jgi:hypothetical protein
LWARVCEHNDKHPLPDGQMTRVTVYVGQNVREPEARDSDNHNDPGDLT